MAKKTQKPLTPEVAEVPSPARQPAAAPPPLRLEWIEAGSLADNPLNWRRHPESQVKSLQDVIKDPEIGWAGACLYNERTGRLIDGHARKSAVAPTTPVPVLVGNWSEDAERKILATLDPLAAMAVGDEQAYAQLAESFTTDSLWIRELVRSTERDARASSHADDEGDDGLDGDAKDQVFPEMELQPFEHYDYVVLLFRNDQDFQGACERLGLGKVQLTLPGGIRKIGLGRVVDGARALEKLTVPTTGGDLVQGR
jgi:hypothetical protein